MEKNIFENAYFGKAYKTEDGRKAIYVKAKYSPCDDRIYLILEGDKFVTEYRPNGSGIYVVCQDIISEWQNSFDEDKMNIVLNEADKLRETAEGRKETGGWYWRKWAEWGYRKALNS